MNQNISPEACKSPSYQPHKRHKFETNSKLCYVSVGPSNGRPTKGGEERRQENSPGKALMEEHRGLTSSHGHWLAL